MPDAQRPSMRSLAVVVAVGLLSGLACGRLVQSPTPAPSSPTPAPSAAAPASGVSDLSLPVSSGSILFRDDFQDGEAQEWQTSGGWFVEQDGDRYYFGTSGEGWAWVSGGGAWTDYLFHAGVRLDSGAAFLTMNMTSAGRYVLRIDQDGLYLIKEQPAGQFTTLAQTGPVAMGTGHSISMAAQAGHLQVYVDRALWIDHNDPAPVLRGTVGVSALEGSRVIVDNVLVAQYAGSLPAGVAQAPPAVDPEPPTPDELSQDLEQAPIEDVPEITAAPEVTPEPDVTPAPEATPTPEALPDLVATRVIWMPDPVVQGQPFQVFMQLLNVGEVPVGAFTVRLHYHAATGLPDCNVDFPSLPPGQEGTAFCNSVTNSNPGTSPTEFTVDVENEIEESDEDNNFAATTFEVAAASPDDGPGDGNGEVPGAQADLVISDVTFIPDPAITGQPFAVALIISNRGDADAGIFTVRLRFHAGLELPDCNWDVELLGAGGSIRLDCTRTTNASPGGYPTELVVDVEEEIAESDETNNSSNQPIQVATP